MKIDIHEKIKSHEQYVQTFGKQGEELILDEFQFEGEGVVNVNLTTAKKMYQLGDKMYHLGRNFVPLKAKECTMFFI